MTKMRFFLQPLPDRILVVAELKAKTGWSNRKIGKYLGISEADVRNYLIMEKLGEVRNVKAARKRLTDIVRGIRQMTKAEREAYVEAAVRDLFGLVLSFNFAQVTTENIVREAQERAWAIPDSPEASMSKIWSSERFHRIAGGKPPEVDDQLLADEREITWLVRVAVETTPDRFLRAEIFGWLRAAIQERTDWSPKPAASKTAPGLLKQPAA